MSYESDLPSPPGLARAFKSTSHVTRLQVALPFEIQSQSGGMYAGLPVETLPAPMLANGQFDPIASRQGFASNEWNSALGDYLAELWLVSMLDLFQTAPKNVWGCVPLDLGGAREMSVARRRTVRRCHPRISGGQRCLNCS